MVAVHEMIDAAIRTLAAEGQILITLSELLTRFKIHPDDLGKYVEQHSGRLRIRNKNL